MGTKAAVVDPAMAARIEAEFRRLGYQVPDGGWSGTDEGPGGATRRFWTASADDDSASSGTATVTFHRVSTIDGVPVYGQAALGVSIEFAGHGEIDVYIPGDPDADSDDDYFEDDAPFGIYGEDPWLWDWVFATFPLGGEPAYAEGHEPSEGEWA